MKKIFISLFSILIFSTLFFNTASAQTNGGVTVATVNINNAKIISQEGRNFVISFNMSNEVGIQPQIRYSVRLTKTSSTSQILFDEKVYDDSLSLGENTSISKTIEYSIPSSLSVGTYSLWINSKNSVGFPLGTAFLGEVKIAENVGNTVEIVPDSCQFFLGEGQFQLASGMTIGPDDIFTAKCKVKSSFSTDTTFKPNFVTRNYTAFGDIASTTGGSNENIIIKKGINEIVFKLPKALKPQNYNLTLDLVSGDSKIISNSIIFNYAISGQSGTIQNVVFDKTYYKAGDTANLQIFSTQPGTSVIIGLVSSEDGNNCSATTSRQISSFSIINLSIPIIEDCINPKANITILAGDKVLSSSDFQVTTVISTTTQTSSESTTSRIIFTSVLFLILIIGTLVYKGKFLKGKYFTLIIASLVVFFSSNIYTNASVTISASPNTIPYNTSAIISWNSIGDYDCSITRSDSGSLWQYSGASFNPTLQLTGFSIPSGSVVDSSGNIYIVDSANNLVKKFNSSGQFLLQITGFNFGYGGVSGIALDSSNNLYVVDTDNHRVRKFNSSGIYLSQFGSRGINNGQFNGPTGIAIDYSGNIYIADTYNNRVQKFNSSGVFVMKFGSYGTANGQFFYPRGIAIDTGLNIFVSDQNHRVQVFNYSGVFVSKFGSYGSADGQFSNPVAIVFPKYFYYQNGNGDDIYIVDRDNNRVQIFSSYGTYKSKIGGFSSPLGISIDLSNSLYVSDGYNGLVQKFVKVVTGSASSGSLVTDTTFTANCRPSYSDSSVTVTVIPPPPVVTLTAATNPVPYNTSTTISWTASGDISGGCTLTGNGTTVWPPTTTSASITTNPLTTATTFSLSCTGLGGTATQDLVVSVIPPPTPVMTISSLSPVAYNGSTTLSWVASGSDSCTLYKNNISQGFVNSISGSTSTGNMIADTTFLLACSGIGGTATTSPLTVKVLPPLSASISADSTLVPYNSSTYIRWNVTGAFSCTITKNGEPFNQMTYNTPATITATTPVVYEGAGVISGIGIPYVPPSYLSSGPITKTTTFTEVCTNGLVSTTTSVVVDTIIPVTVSLSANPTYVSIGSSTTISWSSTGADFCTITKNGMAFATGTSSPGISSGSINSITTFGATCINNHATTTSSLIVVTEPIIEGTINPISITLTSSPTSVESGSSTLIKWNALGAESCSITKNGLPFATGISNPGISSGILTATTTFAALCTNSYTPTKYTYNYSGNFTVPVGVNSITVETWGGGGGGAHTLNGGGGGGGGGGGYGKQTFNVNPGDTYSVIVGNGGGDDDGGETTSFGNLISATGGGGGKWLVWNCLSFCTTAAGAGGISTATINVQGGYGAAGVAPSSVYIPNLKRYVTIPGYGGAGGAGGNGGAGGAGGITCSNGCHGGAGVAPGGGGGGGGVSMSTNNGGAGAKGRVIVTPGSGGTGINSETKSITVAVTPPVIPITIDLNAADLLVLSGSSTTISWSSTGADSCEITKNGSLFATGISNLGISSGILTATTTFAVMCINSSKIETKNITVNVTNNPEELGPINISSTCVPTQPAPFDGNIYVNRTTIWTAVLSTTTLPTTISSSWSGTNISGTVSVNGNVFNKIYTTIGLKTINAIVTGTFGTKQFTSFCSTSTIVKLDTGGGGEI